jgi:hypothetical protein
VYFAQVAIKRNLQEELGRCQTSPIFSIYTPPFFGWPRSSRKTNLQYVSVSMHSFDIARSQICSHASAGFLVDFSFGRLTFTIQNKEENFVFTLGGVLS